MESQGGNGGNLGGNARNMSENAGNQGENAGNLGGNAGNIIEIESLKNQFSFFAEIFKKAKLELS